MLEGLPRLRRFARGLTGNASDTDDLVQSIAEKVLTVGVPEGADVMRWMFRVCKNLYIDQQRALEVRRRAAARPEFNEEPTVNGEDVVIGELTLSEVDREMAKLSERQRAVIMLIAVEGLSYEQAARVLDIPIGTVMSRLARARAILADSLDGETDVPELPRASTALHKEDHCD